MIAIQVWRIAWCSRKDYDKKIGHGKWHNKRVGIAALVRYKRDHSKELFYFIETGEVKI